MDSRNQPPQPKPMDIHPPTSGYPDPVTAQPVVSPTPQPEPIDVSEEDQVQPNSQPITVGSDTSSSAKNGRRRSNIFVETFRALVEPPASDRPRQTPQSVSQQAPQQAPSLEPQPINPGPTGVRPPKKNRLWLKILINLILIVVAAVVAVSIIFILALQPVNPSDQADRQIEIVAGSTPGQIADTLEENGVIRQSQAFNIYTRILGTRNSLQAGHYAFKPSQSTAEIADALVKGPESQDFSITFLPGATLADHKKVLTEAGFSEAEVNEAFAADYDHLLLADKPKSADLEGYIFGETHRFTQGTSVREILERYFDDYYQVIEDNNLIKAYADHDLTLYEGITLASIIQRESGGDDKNQIAQVFYLRLEKGMELGSDVTYQYIADKLGLERDPELKNPYNTRVYEGLPPGPIASPGVESLVAAGSPAKGDYLYFLSGDDSITYYAKTYEEHQANIDQHCQDKCQIL